MKVIVAGSRNFTDYAKLQYVLDKLALKQPIEIVCGEARGADKLGRKYGESRGLVIHSFPADWDTHGKSAGYIRNREMANFSDCLIAFWDGVSKGTKHMIDLASEQGLKVLVIKF